MRSRFRRRQDAVVIGEGEKLLATPVQIDFEPPGLDHDEVTATMKVRRKIVHEKFAPIIRDICGEARGARGAGRRAALPARRGGAPRRPP